MFNKRIMRFKQSNLSSYFIYTEFISLIFIDNCDNIIDVIKQNAGQ